MNSYLNEEAKKALQKVVNSDKQLYSSANKSTPTKNANWYKGEKPTTREALARIYQIGETDRDKAKELTKKFRALQSDSSSMYYNPYTKATTTKWTQTNQNNTIKAQDEWARLSDELSYWATRSDRNYSDEEIIARINWDKYKTLQKMDEGRKTGNPLALLDAVGYSEDAMYGVMWAARNPGKSAGTAEYDAVQSVLGRGNQYKAGDVNAYRDATSDRYSPYKAGATALDDLAYKYGMSGDFTREWLDGEGRSLLNGDAQSREDYTRIYKAVTGTEAVEKEAKAFYENYAKPMIEAGVDPAKIFYDGVFEDLDEYKNLAKFVEGAKSGDLYETAYAVNFDYDELIKQANEYYAKSKGSLSTNEYEEKLATSTGGTFYANEGTQKSNDSKQLNTNILLPDYASVATENERNAFRTTASAGYYDVVGSTYDFVTNGKGGEAEYKETAIAEATAYANENLFGAWDELAQAEAAFAAAGEMDAEVSEFLKANFPDFAKNGKYPTEQEVLDAFRSEKIQMPEGLLPEDQTAFVENIVHSVAGRGQAAEAQAIIDNVLDDFAEAYGKDTEQYRAAIATYEAAYGYKEPKNTWTAFDNYQYASQQEGVTPEMLGNYLTNQRGEVGRQILQVKALIENAEKMGMPKSYIENMQKHLGDLQTQNELLNAHNLAKNEDYSAKIAEFDAAYKPYNFFKDGILKKDERTQADIIRYAVINEGDSGMLGALDENGNTFPWAGVMTDEERANYKYIYMTEGKEKAATYFETLSNNLRVRYSEDSSERSQKFGEEHFLGATAASFATTPFEAAYGAYNLLGKIFGREIDPYASAFNPSQMKGDLRTGSKEAAHNLFDKVLGEDNTAVADWAFDTFYDAVTSAGDSMITAKLGAFLGGSVKGAKATAATMNFLKGFNDGAMDASLRGAGDWQAFFYGVSNAAIEAWTESDQVSKIFDAFSLGSKATKESLYNLLKESFFSEAKEEMLSGFLGNISDELIMGELSNSEAAINQYMTEAGLTREEAELQVHKDMLLDILYQGFVGGLSGTMSSGASYGAGKLFGSDTETHTAEKKTETVPSETAKPSASTPTTESATGNELARAKAALNTSMQTGVSEAQQAATVSGVLQSYGMSDIEANAAAKRIVDSGNTRLLNKMLSKTTNPELLMKAFAMGQVADNSACAVVLNKKIDSSNIHRVTNELLEAYASDTANERVTSNYDAQVAFSAESDMIAAQVAETGALDHTAVDNARAALKDANEQLGIARDEEAAAHKAVVNANAKFSQNPSDPAAKAELKSAIDKQYAAQKKHSEAENRVNAATKKLEAEKQALNAKAEEFMGIAREQVKPEVQKHVEEVNTAKTEQEVAKEVQRESDNVLAMEADEFIDSHYPNVTDEERQQLREQYIGLNQSKETPAEPGYKGGAELLAKAGRKFGFRVVVTDDLNNAEGAYMRDENTIYVAKDITQTEAIKRVLLHEMTHAAEGAGQLYTEMRDTLLSMKYGNNKAQLDADVAALINDYNQFYASRNIIDKKTGRVKQLTKEQAMQELTANVNAEIIAGNQKLIEQLVNEKPSVARRMMDGIKNAIAKMAGVNDPAIDQARNVVKMFEKALSKAQTQSREFDSDGIQYSIREKEPPKNVVYAYKAFYAKDGKLYPPMVSNITDDEDKQKVENATSKTMNSLPTPVGVWLDADIGGIAVDDKGVPERTKDTGRLRVKNDKGGGSLAFRPGWHLGEWPDAKQFNKGELVPYVNYEGETKTRRMLMPDDLVFAKCEVSADVDYQLDALSYGISDKGSFSRSQAGLPYVPDDGFYKYRTNVDPTTAPWLIAGSIKVVEILDDDDCARICAEFGVTPDKRESGKKIDLSEYGLKRGAVEESTEGMERFKENDANRANKKLLQDALNDPAYKDAYVQRDIDFSNKKQYKALQKEFEMNGQDIEDYRKLYEERGFASKLGDMQFSINRKDVEPDEETKYNRFGWIRANDVLSPYEWRTLSSRLTMHEDANYTEQRNLDGDLMIESRDDDNNFSILAISDDNSAYPTVKRIYRFNFLADQKQAKEVKTNIERAESETGGDIYEIAIPYMASGIVEIYDASDYQKHQQNSGRSYSNDSSDRGVHSDSGELQNGRGSRYGSGREGDVTSEGQLSLPSADILQRQMTAYHASRLNPTEDTVRPKSSKLGVSQFAAQTGQNTSVLSNDVKNQLRKSPFYQKTSEKHNIDIAINNIEIEGYEARRNKLLDGSIDLFTPEGQVEAYVLAKAAKEAGDAQGESAIAFKVKESGTVLGQSLAMRRMYLEMTPEGKTQFLQRTVDKINQEYANRGKDTRVVLPEWVEARLAEADGDEELIAKVVDKAYTDIANQMPPDWKSRLNAWRYTAMLANPRTHIRNIAGNLLFMPAVSIKNKIGAVAEMMFVDESERTKTLAPVRKEYKDFAKSQLEDVKDALMGDGKHNPMSEIQSRRKDFKTPVFEWLSKGNGNLLNMEDAIFLNTHFVNALSGFLQARNVDVNNIDVNTLQAGLDYAVIEARKATYRDASELADKLTKFTSGLTNSKKRSARAAGLLMEGALPFKKTPINVMRRGIEYSPVGLLNTLTTGLYDMKKGNVDTSEWIDRLASGVTGTGLAAVGYMLYNLGHLKLSLDEPEDEIEKLGGAQEYSIEIGGKSFTIDWLSPSAMPLFVGGAIAELFEKDGEGFNLNTVTDALMNIAEPVFNLSMLDGVNSLLSAASNSENGVADIALRAAESYASQFVPTVLGAFARTFDPVRRTTYTDKNSGVPSSLQYLYNSTVNKIPGVSKSGQPYLNAWGEEDVTDSWIMRAVENFLSPGYINDLTTDGVEKGLMELFDETKETGLIPKTPQKYFTVNKQRKDLTGEEYEQLTKERGQTAKSLHEQLFGSAEFLNLPAKYQVYALEQVWEYATQTAKQGVASEYEVDSWVAAAKNPATAILERTQDKVKKDRSTEMKNDLYSAIDSGDLVNAMTYVEGIMQGGTEKGSLRTSITNQYKSKYQKMYADGDIEGMRQLENTLLALNVGYKMATIQKWIIDNGE